MLSTAYCQPSLLASFGQQKKVLGLEILIVDDHPVFRAGLRQILLDYSQDLVISEVGLGREALEFLSNREPHAVVLDISLPDLNGIEVLRRIRRSHLRLPVIMLTMHDEEQYGERASKIGATAFFSKAEEPGKLAQAILDIASGKDEFAGSACAARNGEGSEKKLRHGRGVQKEDVA
jgi:DNA-binding NarL/FixJ family response regulator